MAALDLHAVAFPVLDDVQVHTLSAFGTVRSLQDGDFSFEPEIPILSFSSSREGPSKFRKIQAVSAKSSRCTNDMRLAATSV